jgi:hypothetical protein
MIESYFVAMCDSAASFMASLRLRPIPTAQSFIITKIYSYCMYIHTVNDVYIQRKKNKFWRLGSWGSGIEKEAKNIRIILEGKATCHM